MFDIFKTLTPPEIGVLVGGVVMFLVGVFLIGYGIRFLFVCTENVVAKVTEIVTLVSRNGVSYGVAYSYDYGGQTYNFKPKILTGKHPELQEGDLYDIKINPNNPAESYNKKWYIFVALGVVFVVVGVCVSIILFSRSSKF